MWFRTSGSRHMVMMGVSATGRQSLWLKVVDFFGAGTMVADFRQAGMVDCVRKRLKIVVKTCESCAAQALSTENHFSC